ncbi:STAS domain-containing protein [Dactylosporangium sp. NPDC050588]|uniref:STAS domain-containing protein n=1 Tax=Dactylosporangium sp. NPDC050588 TaxID=3157211 RepID=UPI0033D34624
MADLTTNTDPQADGSTVLAVSGEPDVTDVTGFAAAVAACWSTGPRMLVLDLTAVTFIDPTGVGALMRTHRDAQAANRTMIIRPSPPVLRVLGVAGLLHAMPLDPPAPALPTRQQRP